MPELIYMQRNRRSSGADIMLKTIEVEIDVSGHVRPLKSSELIPPGRALLTILKSGLDEATYLAEPALAEDWLRPEEDEAWAHLQPGK